MAQVEVESEDAFEKIILESLGGVVAHFWAEWVPQCIRMNEVMLELAKINTSVKFIRLDAESLPVLGHKYKITAAPTFIFFKNGKVVDRLDGASPPLLTTKIQQLISAIVVPEARTINQDLNERLKILINRAPCMLFMEGTPVDPRSRFSMQIAGILHENKITFSSFNVLADDEVREGLKSYSNFRTFPQFYINGELIGGLDIVKEMAENGELLNSVPKGKLENRLKSLINKSHVMLFMKGNRENPQCGFSKQTIAILNENSIPYETFDILMDDEVRQGLKTFSNWPTYPQLYVKGELIGGLDIIKELQESGELKSSLQL